MIQYRVLIPGSLAPLAWLLLLIAAAVDCCLCHRTDLNNDTQTQANRTVFAIFSHTGRVQAAETSKHLSVALRAHWWTCG
jgi:hypothetical protein